MRGFKRKYGSRRACIKVDIYKAYNSVRRQFIWQILANLGFGGRWLNWVKQCIAAPSFSVLINRSPTGFIKSSRDLCQGNPLSPYLFTMAMEVLSVMLDLEVLRGTISLPAIDKGVSHLIFADDVIVFSSATLKSTKGIEVFNRFARLSGLTLNKEKSAIFLSESCLGKS